jgi:hypothetical protein
MWDDQGRDGKNSFRKILEAEQTSWPSLEVTDDDNALGHFSKSTSITYSSWKCTYNFVQILNYDPPLPSSF